MERVNKIVNVFWLLVLIVSIVWVANIIHNSGEEWEEHRALLFVPVIILLWFLFRRRFTKRMQERMKQGEQN